MPKSLTELYDSIKSVPEDKRIKNPNDTITEVLNDNNDKK